MTNEYGLEQFEIELNEWTPDGASLVWSDIAENDNESLSATGDLGSVRIEVCTRENDEGRWFRGRVYVSGDGDTFKGLGPYLRTDTLTDCIERTLRASRRLLGRLQHDVNDAISSWEER